MIKDVIILYMSNIGHSGRGFNSGVQEGNQAKDSEFLRAIQKAFPMARAAKIELVNERGERVSLAVELLPSISVE